MSTREHEIRGRMEPADLAVLDELEELLPYMTPDQQEQAHALLAEINRLHHIESARDSFLPFVEHVWPEFIRSAHHEVMADAFEKAERGEIKRLMINIAPRHTKSEFASHLFPSWCLGRKASRKIMQCSNTGELAVGFGRKVRNMVNSEEFAEIFPKVELSGDSKAAGRWSTNHKGEYFASGVGGVVTGRGADILIIDDAHSEQEAALNSASVYNNAYEWYKAGPRQRLQPGGVIVIVACLTGDTPVLMASGEEKPIASVRPGDRVATLEDGRITTSVVNNWRSCGHDATFKVQTRSGRTIRANARHPFLVDRGDRAEWVRLKNLRPGDRLVSRRDATGPRSTSDVTSDEVVDISFHGWEEVFDVEIDRTENFIAAGLVTHNTRWSKIDLCGRLLHDMVHRDGDEWHVIELPALLDEYTEDERPIWPSFWSLEELQATRRSLDVQKWQAQYQQALALDTRVPTPSGWTTVRDLRVGDEVIGSDGRPVAVTWKSPVFPDSRLYRVESHCGGEILCNGDHLWAVQMSRADHPVVVRRTDELAERQRVREIEHPEAPRRPRLPKPVAWDLPEVDLPVDPWALGAWLGDGSQGSAAMTASDDDAPFMRSEFERCGYRTSERSKRQTFGVLGLMAGLREMGLLRPKRWPTEVMRGSYDQRLALLQGLMDTDGTVSRGRAAFATVRKEWVEPFCELVLSVGATPFVKSFEMTKSAPASTDPRSTTCWKVEFYHEDAFRMPRKADAARGKKTKHGRFLRFTDTGLHGPTQCIRVAATDGLFLAGDRALLTHNSPVSEEGALVKREWWNEWPQKNPPNCKFVIQAWDTAFTAKQTSDYSACSTWGVWDDEEGNANIILLDAYQARMEFHELKQEVVKQYQLYKPDSFLVEAKAAGWPLIQELRRLGIPVTDVTPVRGQDKATRVNAITDIFASGRVWRPDTRFADLMVEQFAEFPFGDHDDMLDTGVMAITRFRDGGFITLPSDDPWEDEPRRRRRVVKYY